MRLLITGANGQLGRDVQEECHRRQIDYTPTDIEELDITAVSGPATTPAPASSRLLENYPNPFNPSTHIPFELDQPDRVRIAIFDLNGRQVTQLVDAVFEAGHHQVEWNGRDASGRSVASGTYLVRLQVDETVEAERLVLLR